MCKLLLANLVLGMLSRNIFIATLSTYLASDTNMQGQSSYHDLSESNHVRHWRYMGSGRETKFEIYEIRCYSLGN